MSTSECLIEFDADIATILDEYTPFLYQEYVGSWSWELIDGTLSRPSSNSVLVQCEGGYIIIVFMLGSDVMFRYIYTDEPIIRAFFGKVSTDDMGIIYMISDNWVWVSQTWDFFSEGIRVRRNTEFETEYSLDPTDAVNFMKYYIEILTGPNPYFGNDPITVDYDKYALTFNENSEIFYDDEIDPETIN